jgi:hypothetical protein
VIDGGFLALRTAAAKAAFFLMAYGTTEGVPSLGHLQERCLFEV